MAETTYRLVMRTGPTPGQAFDLTQKEMTVGRDLQNTIILNDAEVSRKHARIYPQSGGFVLEDLGSTNGTFVNGQRLMGPHLLRPGEVIFFGETISVAYEVMQFDPNATMASSAHVGAEVAPSPQQGGWQSYPAPQQGYPPAQPAYAPAQPPPVYSQPAPQYSGQIPPGPVTGEVPPKALAPSGRRNLLLLGGGCLILLLCLCLVAAYSFDTLNLYCQGPFSMLSGILYTCP